MREGFQSEIRPALLGAGCTTAAGDTVAATWDGVVSGRNFARAIDPSAWTVMPRFVPRACLWGGPRRESAFDALVEKTLVAYREALAELPADARARVADGRKLGVVLATTKGALDDEIWKGERARLEHDFFSPILAEVLRVAELRPARKSCVSNACSSSLSAIALARSWLAAGDLDDVLVLAVDRIGPFVLHGFHCLRAVSSDVARPFAADRSGLLLGEASAALFFSRFPGEFRLAGVGVDAEGFAVTRPADSGESLRTACRQAADFALAGPDLVIAHGTATEVNDPIEARVLGELLSAAKTPITATKGALGHTLGASGAIDLILARESMRRGLAFTISQTATIDPKFTGNFLASPSSEIVATVPGKYSRVLVTSLGFGGIHAAAMLERVGDTSAAESSAGTAIPARDRPTPVAILDEHEFRFPTKLAPKWAAQVERWYQLDAFAFGMAEAAERWSADVRPDVVFLASAGGSNATDAEFAAAGARSPALFVHSLPNVRSSAFCQVLDWHGTLYCFQTDPDTFERATDEARRYFRSTGKRVWVLSIEKTADAYLARRFRIGAPA